MKIIMSRFARSMSAALFFVLLPGAVSGAELIDLEKGAQEFVLETKQIHIPGFPGAFNASMVRWRNKLLLCFRARDAHMISKFDIGLVWLDDNFNVISAPQLLDIRDKHALFPQPQDPRLIIINEQPYMVYSNFTRAEETVTRRMFMAELKFENDTFFIEDPLCLHPFEGSGKQWEKNWVPFNHHEDLFLTRTLMPHHVVKPLDCGECTTESISYPYVGWKWGILRGGTPAVLDGDEYVAFFHSSKNMETVHSRGEKMLHYFMGAYTFSSQSPFEMKRISPAPIVGKNFYEGATYTTWKPLRVVFPMGCIVDENYFWITYGRQDFEIWVVKIDKKALYESLVPCPQLTKQEFEAFYAAYKEQIVLENMSEDFCDHLHASS